MRIARLLSWAALAVGASSLATRDTPSIAGVEALVQRRLPQHVNSFQFEIVNASQANGLGSDRYVVSSAGGKILVQGNTLSALLSGYVDSANCNNVLEDQLIEGRTLPPQTPHVSFQESQCRHMVVYRKPA